MSIEKPQKFGHQNIAGIRILFGILKAPNNSVFEYIRSELFEYIRIPNYLLTSVTHGVHHDIIHWVPHTNITWFEKIDQI